MNITHVMPQRCGLPVSRELPIVGTPAPRMPILPPLALPLLLTLSVQGLIAFSMFTLPVLLPAYSAELGVGAPFAGTATASVYGGAAVTALFVSGHVRGIGAIRMCQMALLLVALGLGLASTGSLPALVAGALAIGLGYGPVTAASALLLTRSARPGSYGLVFSINRMSIPIGAAIAGAMLPSLSGWIGWRASLAGTGLVCICFVGVLQFARRLDTDHRPTPESLAARTRALASLRELVSHPRRRVLTQASLAFLAAQSCLAAFTVAFLVGELSLSYVKAGAILAAAQMSGVVARLVMGYVSDRSTRRTAVIGIIGLAIALATALLAVASPGWHSSAILGIFLLYGAGALGWNGVMLAELAHTTSPERSGEIAGASSAIAFAGAVAGPVIFSSLLAYTGYSGAFVLLSLAVLVCSVSLIRFDIRATRREAPG